MFPLPFLFRSRAFRSGPLLRFEFAAVTDQPAVAAHEAKRFMLRAESRAVRKFDLADHLARFSRCEPGQHRAVLRFSRLFGEPLPASFVFGRERVEFAFPLALDQLRGRQAAGALWPESLMQRAVSPKDRHVRGYSGFSFEAIASSEASSSSESRWSDSFSSLIGPPPGPETSSVL